jgi:hypothetical protein
VGNKLVDGEGLSGPTSGVLEKFSLPFLNESRAPASENELVADEVVVVAER